jgi:hypothetical protein
MQCRNATLYTGILFLLENPPTPPSPTFSNAKYKCAIIYWGYFMFREYPSFQMESTNVTLLTGVMLMLNRITPLPPFPNTKYKCHIVSWDYFLLKRIPSTFFPNVKYKYNIIYWVYAMFKRLHPGSKCKVQMRLYLLGFFHALDNPPFQNAK